MLMFTVFRLLSVLCSIFSALARSSSRFGGVSVSRRLVPVQRSLRLLRSVARSFYGRASLLLIVSCLISPCAAIAQNFPITPGSIGNLIEQTVTTKAAQLGLGSGELTGTALDAAFSAGELTVIDSATALAGAAAVGNPVTWGAVAAVGAAALVGGTVCLTVGCDLSGIATSLSPVTYNAGSGVWNAVSYLIGGGTILYSGSSLLLHKFVGTSQNAVGAQMCADSVGWNSGGGFGVVASTAWTYVSGSTGTCTLHFNPNSIIPSGYNLPEGFTIGSGTGYNLPSGGLSCAGGSAVFNVSGISTPTTLNCAEDLPGAGGSSPFAWSPSTFSTAEDAEPINPGLIANLANQVAQQVFPPSGTAPGGFNMPSGSISSQDAAQVMQADRFTPTLGDMFGTPVAPNSLVTLNSSGVAVPSVTPTGTSLTTTAPLDVSRTGTALTTSAPCGNLMAGEQPCGDYIDAPWYQWMDEESAEVAACQSLAAQTPSCVQTQINLMTRTIVTTQTATADKTDTLTSVQTATQTATLTQDATLTDLGTPRSVAIPSSSSLPLPSISLPFDEWPSVFNQLQSANLPAITGQCPTVTFTSSILHNTSFTISAQCLVMNSMAPYMAYVLPATYLFMAFLLIMAA